MTKTLMRTTVVLLFFAAPQVASAGETTLRIDTSKLLQAFGGMGCGAIFYEGHITSLAKRNKHALQEELYDTLFADVSTDFLQLMIRHDHEPTNDNADPYLPEFDAKFFAAVDRNIEICRAARVRNPKMKFFATLYTPPVWMKTNGDISGGGEERATIKPNMEEELAEFCWAFLAHMQKGGIDVEFLSIANEPDWPHDQPGYCMTSDQHAKVLKKVDHYLDKMAETYPSVPRVKLVGPNTLSAVGAAKKWLPEADRVAPGAIEIVGTHDYDRRGKRFTQLAKVADGRPLWVTEWCVNGKDTSEGLYRSANEYWLAMTEAFNQGANVWMAYDWVYPPRDGGEALVHVDWGKGFTKTKIYHGFRQWCAPLKSGMRVVSAHLTGAGASGVSEPGVKASAFISEDGKTLVVHAANVQEKDASLRIDPGEKFADLIPSYSRTTADEDALELPRETPLGDQEAVPLSPRSMHTWVWSFE